MVNRAFLTRTFYGSVVGDSTKDKEIAEELNGLRRFGTDAIYSLISGEYEALPIRDYQPACSGGGMK